MVNAEYPGYSWWTAVPSYNVPEGSGGPIGSLAQRYPEIVAAYQTYLGRPPSQQEIMSHTGGGTFSANDWRLQLSVQAIQNSPEAQAYAKTKTTPKPDPEPDPKPGPTDLPGMQAAIWGILQKYPHTPAGLVSALVDIKKIYPNAKIVGSKGDKLDLTAYGGSTYDVITNASAGGTGWQWLDTATSGSGGGGGLDPNSAFYNPLTNGSLMTPYGESFTPASWAGSTPYGEFTSYPDFVPPTAADMNEDPGYQVRLAEGQHALESSAAAHGNFFTGGTMKSLTRYGQEQASKEYAAIYGRRANTWGLNAGNQLTGYTTNRDTWGSNQDLKYRDWQARYDAALKQYQTRYGTWNDQRNFNFNNLYKLATLGASSV
jgi:hypothetical protein